MKASRKLQSKHPCKMNKVSQYGFSFIRKFNLSGSQQQQHMGMIKIKEYDIQSYEPRSLTSSNLSVTPSLLKKINCFVSFTIPKCSDVIVSFLGMLFNESQNEEKINVFWERFRMPP